MQIEGAVTLISGASGGLGRALAVELAKRGAKLALCARDREGLAKTEALAEAAGCDEIRLYRCDISKPAARALPARVARDFGGLDALVNNAGVHAFSTVAELPESLLQEALQVNLFGALRLTQGALPALRASHGLVVNIGSTLGYRAIPTGGAYSATKAALARLSEALRDEETKNGVSVLHLNPGVVLTGLRKNALTHNVDVAGPGKLPYPREAGDTAYDIAEAMEDGEREAISAAWQVKLWAKVLVPWLGKSVDRKMRMN